MPKKQKTVRGDFLQKIRKTQGQRYRIQEEGQRDRSPKLLEISDALDDYYFFEKLLVYCAYLSYRLMVAPQLIPYRKSDFKLIKSILRQLQQKEDQHPAMDIYLRLCQLFEKPHQQSEQAAIESLKDIEGLILSHQAIFSTGELVELYSYLTNYAIYQLNAGKQGFLIHNIAYNHELIQLEKQRKKNTVINVGVYKNTVALILKAAAITDRDSLLPYFQKDFATVLDWANYFIEENKNYLPKRHGEKYYQYTKALILFHKGQYPKALSIVESLPRPRVFFLSLDLKVLHLRLLIELLIEGEEERDEEMLTVLERLRDTLKQDRNQRPKLNYQREHYAHFYKLCKRFLAFYMRFAWMDNAGDEKYDAERRQLEKMIQGYSYSYCPWFLAKVQKI